MKLTPEQVQEIFESAKPDIIAGLKAEITRQASWDVTSVASTAVKAEITKFVTEEIVPEIRTLLIESKAGIISTVVPVCETISVELTKALAEEMKKKLEQSYTRAEILKTLFGR